MNSEIFSMFRCLEIDNEKEKREATPRTWTRRAALVYVNHRVNICAPTPIARGARGAHLFID